MSEVELRHIVRFKDSDLDGTVSIQRSLHKVKGLSFSTIKAFLNVVGFDSDKKLGLYTDEELKKLTDAIENPSKYGLPAYLFNRRRDYDTGIDKHLVSVELELEQKSDISRERQIKSYRGVRHATGQKVRGQRTKSTGRKGTAAGVKKKK